MNLTPEQKQVGKDNFQEAVGFNRRSFLKGAAAAVPGLGAVYFGYDKLQGNPVRVGFIGTGDEGSVLLNEHPPEYMDVIAVADIRPTNRKRALHGDGNDVRQGLIRKLGAKKAESIKVYDDHHELLQNPDIEAVVIAVPLNQHAQIAIDALEAGKHVLTEKLMAHSVAECKQMIAKAREKHLLLAVGHQRHYSVLYDNANHLIREGLLGTIKFIRAQWHRNNSFPGKDSWNKRIHPEDAKALKDSVQKYGYESMEKLVNWRLYNETGGGLMAELGSHQLDACSIFLGKVHPIAVQGFGGKNFFGVPGVGPKDKWEDRREIDDHVYVTFEFPGPNYADNKDDIVIVTYSSINTNSMEPYGETVFGSRGTLIMEQEQEALLFKEASSVSPGGGPDQRLWVIQGDGGTPVLSASETLAPTQQVSSNVTGKVSRGYTEEMEHFCHCIRTENYGPPSEGGLRCNGVQGMADAVMALTSNLAMKHKKRIIFKGEWFDPDSPAVPDDDSQLLA
jgi:predicted dehydrogenase